MKKLCILLAGSMLLCGCEQASTPAPAAAATTRSLNSGIDLEGMDTGVRPQDDFFAYANGSWVANTEIPAHQTSWGGFTTLRDDGLGKLKVIIEELVVESRPTDAQAKIGDYYQAYMDVEKANALGVTPLADDFDAIDKIATHDDVVAFLASRNEYGLGGPFDFYINQDDKDPTKYVIFLSQSGLGLPDRDYYFDESVRGLELRDKYLAFVRKMMELAGHDDPWGAATRILSLETRLAEPQWTRVDNRDADKVYNKYSDAELDKLLSNYNLDAWFAGVRTGRQEYVIVMQPSYLKALNSIFRLTELDTWKDYSRLQVLKSYANFLSQEFVETGFDFYQRTLRGREEQLPRWQRAIGSVNRNLGELVGQIYVVRHFRPEAKARMVDLVNNLLRAYEESIQDLDWMSDETKAQALIKLSKFTPKIGYPDEWRDYSALEISADDLVGNIKRSRSFRHYFEVDKLGKPIDRDEWHMPPQTVNAYYNPGLNEIVFPAAILQPPFFILDAEDARNYGAIGVVIGHEIGHGFDDQGSKYDGDGNLRSWWTDSDRSKFEERTRSLVEQYNGYEALPGLSINGRLTLGENIGDLGGAAIALRAYELSLNGEEAPIIDGMTGRERFFLGLGQVWRSKYRKEVTELRVKSDPHSPSVFRVNGVVPNVDAFYETFNVREGDSHYLSPDERVRIWR